MSKCSSSPLTEDRRAFEGAQLGHGEEEIPDGKSDRGVLLLSALSPLLLGVCHIQQVVSPSFLYQQAFTRGKGIRLFPGLGVRTPTFQKSLIPFHCTQEMFHV